MNIKHTTSLIAFVAVMGTNGMAGAITTTVAGNGSSSFDAAVSVLSPDQTGFIIGGQVSVNGLGSGAVTLSRSAAQMAVTGSAKSVLDPVSSVGPIASPYLVGVISNSDITSSLDFSRDITTAGSLVGQGAVTARGEAIGSMGTAGAASANTTTAGTRADSIDVAGGEGSASAQSSSQGSLNGSVSTANTLQLLGTSGLFAASNSLDVGETNKAIAYGSSSVTADGVSGIDLTSAASTGSGLLTGTGNGALFAVSSSLTDALGGASTGINLSVSNAGNGTVALTASTGGFFTGGGAAGGSATHVDNGSFFNPSIFSPIP